MAKVKFGLILIVGCVFGYLAYHFFVKSEQAAPKIQKQREQIEQPPKTEQKKQTSENKNNTQAKKTHKTTDYTLPHEVSYNKSGNDFLNDIFRPIGWSHDGKFAYITEYTEEARDCFSMRIEIVDLAKNKILWEWNYEDKGAGEDFQTVWQNNYALFKKQLNKHGINPKKEFVFKPNRFNYKGEEFQIVLETKTDTDPDFGFEVITQGDIVLESKKSKRLIKKFKEEAPSLILGAYIHGYLQSPDKNIIGILYKRERRGYEGPPHVVNFSFAGYDLSKNM